jgi:hypothetical protein
VNNRDKNFTVAKVGKRIEQVDASVARYLAALDRADREESDVAEAKSGRLKEKIAGLRRQMQSLKEMAQQVHAAPDQQVSLTDPNARSMATSGRGTRIVGYNVQIAVDAEHQLIVAHGVINQGYDRHQLAPMAFKAQQATGCEQITALADRGYFNGDQVLSCEGTGVAPIVPKTLTSGGTKTRLVHPAGFHLRRRARPLHLSGARKTHQNPSPRRINAVNAVLAYVDGRDTSGLARLIAAGGGAAVAAAAPPSRGLHLFLQRAGASARRDGCRSNKGAPGVDGQDFAEVEAHGLERWLGELALALREETYRPDPIRRVYISKANGKLRPLGISTLRDRVCMTAATLVLEPIFEADLPPEQYAYRPGRNAQQAAVQVEELLFRGHRDVVDTDLADFFGSIPHPKLIRSVARRIVDRRVLHLIKM